MCKSSVLFLSALVIFPALAQTLEPVSLPKPQTEGGKPLLEALRERKSSREFSPAKLPVKVLSNLLWAAAGVNRPDGRRTAPTASNRQEIDLYVTLPEGVYLYEPKSHSLQPVAAGDFRALTGGQSFVGSAPVNLVFVADFAKMGGQEQSRIFYSAADTGFVSQNVYLFCASEGLATVVRGTVDRPELAKALKLRREQRITLAQTVGYPVK
jgi:SagB-type dehydrogenase family enzyme